MDVLDHILFYGCRRCEPVEWRSGTIISAKQFFFQILNEKRRTSHVAYQDIRLRPKLPLTEELAGRCIEDYISDMDMLPNAQSSSSPNQTPDTGQKGSSIPDHNRSQMTPIAANECDNNDPAKPVNDDVPPIPPVYKDIGQVAHVIYNHDTIHCAEL